MRSGGKWGEEIVCCSRNVKVTFLALFPGWCHSGERAKGHDFPEGIYILSRLFVGTYCPLWSQTKTKLGLFLPCLSVPGQVLFEAGVWNLCRSLCPATSCTFIYLLKLLFRASQLLCTGLWEGCFPLLCRSTRGCEGCVPELTPEVDYSTL